MKLYLQNIVDDISFENLPAKWQGFDSRKLKIYHTKKNDKTIAKEQ